MAPTQTQDNPILAEFERIGFEYELEPQFDLDNLSKDRRVQVRESHHYAPPAEVKQYAVQMAYSQFPPVIVTQDGWLIDGNTRVGGSLKRGQKFFPAFVLAVEYEKTTQKRKEELHALALTLNQMNGRRLTPAEQRNEARRLIGLGWKSEAIQQSAGISNSTVSSVRKELEAERKMARVGVGANGEIKATTKRALAHKSAQALNDQPFRDLVTLATDADLKASEVTDLAKQIDEKGSEQEQVQVLTNLRSEFADRIRQKQLTGSGKPPAARQLRQALGAVTRFAGQESTLVETNPDMAAEHKVKITDAIDVLQKVLAEQERHDQK